MLRDPPNSPEAIESLRTLCEIGGQGDLQIRFAVDQPFQDVHNDGLVINEPDS